MAEDSVTLVMRMWDAWTEGRMDDVVATMHRFVTWQPLTRPARPLYAGHSGIRRMREDVARVHGTFHTEMRDFTLMNNSYVYSRGLLIAHEEAIPTSLAFDARCVIRDDLIYAIESRPLGVRVLPEFAIGVLV